MTFAIVFAPEAEEQLAEIYAYVAARASPDIASNYAAAIVASCEGLQLFPHRGTARNDLRSGLRLTHFKGRTVIAYAVDDIELRVTLLGVYYGGQDHESALRAEEEH